MKKEKIIIDAEYSEKESIKKNNKFSKIFETIKKNLNHTFLEAKIDNSYKKDHDEFKIYQKDAVLPITIYGKINGMYLETISNVSISKYSIVLDCSNNKTYYIFNKKEIEINVVVDNVKYTKLGTKYLLKDDLEEVDVIKAGKRFYIYKG